MCGCVCACACVCVYLRGGHLVDKDGGPEDKGERGADGQHRAERDHERAEGGADDDEDDGHRHSDHDRQQAVDDLLNVGHVLRAATQAVVRPRRDCWRPPLGGLESGQKRSETHLGALEQVVLLRPLAALAPRRREGLLDVGRPFDPWGPQGKALSLSHEGSGTQRKGGVLAAKVVETQAQAVSYRRRRRGRQRA